MDPRRDTRGRPQPQRAGPRPRGLPLSPPAGGAIFLLLSACAYRLGISLFFHSVKNVDTLFLTPNLLGVRLVFGMFWKGRRAEGRANSNVAALQEAR